MMRLSVNALIAVAVVAGCGGGSIESKVQGQYGDYAARHGFDSKAKTVDSVTCTEEPTHRYDGWCKVRPKGFRLSYDVPYKGDTVFWGESGVGKAPS